MPRLLFRALRVRSRSIPTYTCSVEASRVEEGSQRCSAGWFRSTWSTVLVCEREEGAMEPLMWICQYYGGDGVEEGVRKPVIHIDRSVGMAPSIIRALPERERNTLTEFWDGKKDALVVPLDGIPQTALFRCIVAICQGTSPSTLKRLSQDVESKFPEATLHACLVGKVVVPGCSVSTPVLGENIWLLIIGVSPDEPTTPLGVIHPSTRVALAGPEAHLLPLPESSPTTTSPTTPLRHTSGRSDLEGRSGGGGGGEGEEGGGGVVGVGVEESDEIGRGGVDGRGMEEVVGKEVDEIKRVFDGEGGSGVLVCGPPGSGKRSMIQAAASSLKRPIRLFWVSPTALEGGGRTGEGARVLAQVMAQAAQFGEIVEGKDVMGTKGGGGERKEGDGKEECWEEGRWTTTFGEVEDIGGGSWRDRVAIVVIERIEDIVGDGAEHGLTYGVGDARREAGLRLQVLQHAFRELSRARDEKEGWTRGRGESIAARPLDAPMLCKHPGQVVVVGLCGGGVERVTPLLRNRYCFAHTLTIELPDSDARVRLICREWDRLGIEVAEEVVHALKEVAPRLTGFTPADLYSLAASATRTSSTSSSHTLFSSDAAPATTALGRLKSFAKQGSLLANGNVTVASLQAAVIATRPSGVHGVSRASTQVGWDGIGGLDDVKTQLQRAVEWPLKCPELLARMHVQAPRGVLLFGLPGCAKTLLAKAAASAASAAFFSLSGADVLSKYVGESERALRRVFARARAAAPAVVFLDEIDALVSTGAGGGRSGASSSLLATLLTEMDGVTTSPTSSPPVLVLAATNRPERIDAALLRPGRFDFRIHVPPPDLKARESILRIHLSRAPIQWNCPRKGDDETEREDAAKHLASQTERFTGAELAGLCRHAALAAVREALHTRTSSSSTSSSSTPSPPPLVITQHHFEEAFKATTTMFGNSASTFSFGARMSTLNKFASGAILPSL